MAKYFRQIIILSMAIMFVTGCGKQEKKIEVSSLCNSGGYFQFGDMEWGSTQEQAEKVLGFSFGEPISASDEYTVYLEEDAFNLDGLSANMMCEFRYGKLSSVSLMLYPEETEIEDFWSGLAESLMKEYGNVELIEQSGSSGELQISAESKTYLWEREGSSHTTLQLTRISNNGKFKYINLSVNNIDLAKAVAE